jgi:hypothetical protein
MVEFYPSLAIQIRGKFPKFTHLLLPLRNFPSGNNNPYV